MRAFLSIFTLIIIALSSCSTLPDITPATSTPTQPFSTPTQPFRKQPEPQRPLVSGEISGVSEGTLVTFHVRTLAAGWEALTGTLMGNGTWQAVVTEASGVDYIVTAEAEGYMSAPISYTIHLEGLEAYLVENGQVTDQEASHLDFHFESK
jgi:hypothetical protein